MHNKCLCLDLSKAQAQAGILQPTFAFRDAHTHHGLWKLPGKKKRGKSGAGYGILTQAHCPAAQPARRGGRKNVGTRWGMCVPKTACVGVQDWEMGKELQGYPEVSLFIPGSTKSSSEQLFFPVFRWIKWPFFPTETHFPGRWGTGNLQSPISPSLMGSGLSFTWV